MGYQEDKIKKKYLSDLEGKYETLRQTYEAPNREPQCGINFLNFILDEYDEQFDGVSMTEHDEKVEEAREEGYESGYESGVEAGQESVSEDMPCQSGVLDLLKDLENSIDYIKSLDSDIEDALTCAKDAKETVEGYINQVGW